MCKGRVLSAANEPCLGLTGKVDREGRSFVKEHF